MEDNCMLFNIAVSLKLLCQIKSLRRVMKRLHINQHVTNKSNTFTQYL